MIRGRFAGIPHSGWLPAPIIGGDMNGGNTDHMRGTRALVIAASLVVIIYGLQAAQSILVPFILAALISVIAASPMRWMEKRGVPKGIAVLIVVAGFMAFIALIGTYVGTSISEFSRRMPVYEKNLEGIVSALVTRLGFEQFDSLKKLIGDVSPGSVLNFVGGMINGLRSIFANTFLIIFIMVFILLEISSITGKLAAFTGSGGKKLGYYSRFSDSVRRYLGMKSLVSLATGVLVGVWVAVLGLDFPILWGLLAFFLNFIPSIGSIMAAIPAILLALVQFGPARAGLVALGYIIINLVIGSLLEPRMMGRRMGLSTLVVFLSLVFWGWVFGAVGMLLAIPLTMMLKIALESSPKTNRIAILLGSSDAVLKESKDESGIGDQDG